MAAAAPPAHLAGDKRAKRGRWHDDVDRALVTRAYNYAPRVPSNCPRGVRARERAAMGRRHADEPPLHNRPDPSLLSIIFIASFGRRDVRGP